MCNVYASFMEWNFSDGNYLVGGDINQYFNGFGHINFLHIFT